MSAPATFDLGESGRVMACSTPSRSSKICRQCHPLQPYQTRFFDLRGGGELPNEHRVDPELVSKRAATMHRMHNTYWVCRTAIKITILRSCAC